MGLKWLKVQQFSDKHIVRCMDADHSYIAPFGYKYEAMAGITFVIRLWLFGQNKGSIYQVGFVGI
mgnify:CR=1 FL=1